MLVAEREGTDGHVDNAAEAEAKQNPFLHPRVHAPAGGRGRVWLRRAYAALVKRGAEFFENAKVVVGVLGRFVVEEAFDISLQRALSPVRRLPAPSQFWSCWQAREDTSAGAR